MFTRIAALILALLLSGCVLLFPVDPDEEVPLPRCTDVTLSKQDKPNHAPECRL
jgi:PBP1b-binding outer membrane lipoprotein LpoB